MLDKAIKYIVLSMLSVHGGSRRQTAEILGVPARTLDHWLSTWPLVSAREGRGVQRELRQPTAEERQAWETLRTIVGCAIFADQGKDQPEQNQ